MPVEYGVSARFLRRDGGVFFGKEEEGGSGCGLAEMMEKEQAHFL